MSSRTRAIRWLVWVGLCALGVFQGGASELNWLQIKPLLDRYCLECHGGDKVKGEVDFSLIQTWDDAVAQYELWETVVERLRESEMPPEDEPQPTPEEKNQILRWYQSALVDSVQASPGPFQPRRLSAKEYRNTLRSVFGFDLEVAIIKAEQTLAESSLVLKLLPTDPPGASGFTNDTHTNPLTPLIWGQYSYLIDSALDRLFSATEPSHLVALAGPGSDGDWPRERVDHLLREVWNRALRRPVEGEKLAAGVERVCAESDREQAVRAEIKAILMSPGFLYRGLLMTSEEPGQQAVDDYEYAERLSYFLWGDMPDETLRRLAGEGELRRPSVIAEQVDRLLASPKARHLADTFAWEWFSLGEMDTASGQVPMVVALRTQVMDFVQYLFRENRPIMELIDSETTFINPFLARYYPKDRRQMAAYRKQKGIEMEIVAHQRIRLEHTKERGGLLTMPGILAMNRGPVLRGVWMLERILGEHLPEPPPDVGQVPANGAGENRSFRERFEAHRSQATCAICHDKIDPLGFAAQGYDQRGGYTLVEQAEADDGGIRFLDKDGKLIDTSGQMPNGEPFASFDELKTILMTSYRPQIMRNVVERTLAFGLCRKLALHDRPTVDAILAELEAEEGGFRDLVLLIVKSLPFRETVVKPGKS